MAQYMISVFHNAGVQESGAAYQDEAAMQRAFTAVNEFNNGLQSAGQFVFACGLMPPEEAHSVDATTESPIISKGAFSAEGPALGGFWIVEVVDESAALELARQASSACGQRVELRPLQG